MRGVLISITNSKYTLDLWHKSMREGLIGDFIPALFPLPFLFFPDHQREEAGTLRRNTKLIYTVYHI
jgi:hypothetical protein